MYVDTFVQEPLTGAGFNPLANQIDMDLLPFFHHPSSLVFSTIDVSGELPAICVWPKVDYLALVVFRMLVSKVRMVRSATSTTPAARRYGIDMGDVVN
jgi:hypothetical protein